LLALSLIPGDNGIDLAGEAAFLSAQMSLSGFMMHVLNDRLIASGRAHNAA
jgi:hypothetical protein